MTKKENLLFKCRECGYQTPQWMGRCPECGQWDSIVKEKIQKKQNGSSGSLCNDFIKPIPIHSIEFQEEPRISTGIREVDRVLGGGIVEGSLILIGGDPGIGKSTLMLQALSTLAKSGKKTLYISGEESTKQIKMRGQRLEAESPYMFIASETNLDSILSMIDSEMPHAVVIDSIQTIYNPEIGSTPGSLAQIREASIRLMNFAKETGVPIFLVGHVTKDGAIAGPKIMEHMVDTVLYFEGDRNHMFRILRTVKNRFGSTNEIGVFEMKEKGLEQVTNPSAMFLSERSVNTPGSVVTASMEGSRPILVEIQGLVSTSGFGTPRRTILGLDPNRVALIAAVMEKRLGINLSGFDLFMNVAGGVKLVEPAADLGIAVALASSFLDKPVHEGVIVFGEVGLTGEIRATSHANLRINEAEKMGFSKSVIPRNCLKHKKNTIGMDIQGISSLKEIIGFIV